MGLGHAQDVDVGRYLRIIKFPLSITFSTKPPCQLHKSSCVPPATI